MPDTTLAVNGISVLVEYPERLTAPLRRASSGTWIQQDSGTWNWFHFAPATLVVDRGTNVELSKIRLNGSLEHARLERLHLRAGGSLVWRIDEGVWGLTTGGFYLAYPTGTSFRYLPEAEREPIERLGHASYCLSARVSFTESPGRIRFDYASFNYFIPDAD